MKTILSYLLLFAHPIAFSQNKTEFDPDYNSFPQDSISFHYCSECAENERYSFPLEMTDSVFFCIFGMPDYVSYFSLGEAYFMTYADKDTDTVALYTYNTIPKDSAVHKAGFMFLKYPGHVKLAVHNLLPGSSFHFGSHVLTTETTPEDIRNIFPRSYETALHFKYGPFLVSDAPVKTEISSIRLYTFPWNSFYDRNGYEPAPSITLMFVNGKLAALHYETRT